MGKWAKPVVKLGSIGDIDQTFNSAVFVHKYESWSKNMTSSRQKYITPSLLYALTTTIIEGAVTFLEAQQDLRTIRVA